MRMNDPDTCEHFAKTFGTKTTTKITERTSGSDKTGEGSIREVEQYIYHPNVFKNLPTGVGVVSIPHRDGIKLMKIRFEMLKKLRPVPLPAIKKTLKPLTFPPPSSQNTAPKEPILSIAPPPKN